MCVLRLYHYTLNASLLTFNRNSACQLDLVCLAEQHKGLEQLSKKYAKYAAKLKDMLEEQQVTPLHTLLADLAIVKRVVAIVWSDV